jgi:peptide/nickel transport system permease protein
MHWLTKRIGRAVLTIYVVITLSFALIRMMPGGPVAYIKAQLLSQESDIDPQQARELAEVYLNVRPDKPLWNQYLDYIAGIATGDFGKSIWYNEPVADILAEALPWTIFLMLVAILFQFILGIALGAALAYHEGNDMDLSGTIGSMLANSIPYYVLAIFLSYIFAYNIGWFPIGEQYNASTTPGVNWPFIAGVLHHAALPLISFIFTGFGGWAIAMRGNSIRVLGEDYLRVARLRGLPGHVIAFRYIGRNAILPMYTQFFIALGFLFGGSIILETIFQYPGVGWYMFNAVNARDYPLMMGAFIIITTAVVLGVFIADLTYGKVDPRISAGGDDYESY